MRYLWKWNNNFSSTHLSTALSLLWYWSPHCLQGYSPLLWSATPVLHLRLSFIQLSFFVKDRSGNGLVCSHLWPKLPFLYQFGLLHRFRQCIWSDHCQKAGTCKIKVKSGKSETYCQIQVVPTTISLNKTALSLEKQQTFQLTARTSNHSVPTYRSNKKVSHWSLLPVWSPHSNPAVQRLRSKQIRQNSTVKLPLLNQLSLYPKQPHHCSAVRTYHCGHPYQTKPFRPGLPALGVSLLSRIPE